MADKNDYHQEWSKYLSYGYRVFSKKLLTPNIALIVSHDGSKQIVIGDNEKDPPYEYDEQERRVYVDLRYLPLRGGKGSLLFCPSCRQFYIIRCEGCDDVNVIDDVIFDNDVIRDDVIFIKYGTRIFDCTCGVKFIFNDIYASLSLPFKILELAPLHVAGMPLTADLFVRYILNPNGKTLIEDVGVVTQGLMNNISLTENPSFRFLSWFDNRGPAFISENGYVYDVRIWRTRTYKFGSNTFKEKTYHPSLESWKTVVKDVRDIPDDYVNRRLLESISVASKNQPDLSDVITKSTRGGANRIPEYPWSDVSKRIEFINRVNELYRQWVIALDSQMEKKYEYEWINMVKGNSDCNELCDDLLKEAINKRMVSRETGIAIIEDYQARAYSLKQAAIELGVTKKNGRVYAYETLKKYFDGTLQQINSKHIPR